MKGMNLIDLVAAVVVLLGALLGYRVGVVRQLGGLLGAGVGIALTILVVNQASTQLEQLDDLARVALIVAGLVLSAFLGQSVGSLVGSKVANGDEAGAGGAANRWAGALVGAAEGIVVVWLLGSLVTVAPDPNIARMAQKSAAIQTLSDLAPPPATLAQELTQSLAGADLGLLFDGVIPQPAAPTKLPGNEKVRAVAKAAAPSVVKVVRAGCGLQGVGSGAVISPRYVVTNAHVVAGGSLIQVDKNGRRFEAIPVRVDRKLDAALLFVPELPAPPLNWSSDDPRRGTQGAVLGYPGGGSFTAGSASVSREINALGRSISGNGTVSREVLELRARVEPGNSGGPLILMDGTIGGIIFAESPSNPKVGYALAPTDVIRSLEPAIGRTAPVNTGSCQS